MSWESEYRDKVRQVADTLVTIALEEAEHMLADPERKVAMKDLMAMLGAWYDKEAKATAAAAAPVPEPTDTLPTLEAVRVMKAKMAPKKKRARKRA